MKKFKVVFVIMAIIIFFVPDLYSQTTEASNIKISVNKFESKNNVETYNYLSNSLQNSIFASLNNNDGIKVISNDTSNKYAEELSLYIKNVEKLSVMLRFGAKTQSNVIILGEYAVDTDKEILSVKVYVYSIAQRDVIILFNETTDLNNVYDLIDRISLITTQEVLANKSEIEIALDEMLGDVSPPEYLAEPQIMSVGLDGILIRWETDKPTASKMLLLDDKDRNSIINEYLDFSDDAQNHSVLIPIADVFEERRTLYFTSYDVDFLDNEIEAEIRTIKKEFILDELKSTYEKELQTYKNIAENLEKEESYESALSTLKTALTLVKDYSKYIDTKKDKQYIENEIERLKNIVEDISTIEDPQDNTDTDTDEPRILLYNQFDSKTFQNDLMLEVKMIDKDFYGALTLSNIYMFSSASLFTIFGFGVTSIPNHEFYSILPFSQAGFNLIGGIVSWVQYINIKRKIDDFVIGVDSDKIQLSKNYNYLLSLQNSMRKTTRTLGTMNIIWSVVSFIGILPLAADVSTSSDVLYTASSMILSIFGLMAGTVYQMVPYSFDTMPNVTENSLMTPYYRNLFQYGYMMRKNFSNYIFYSFLNPVFGLIELPFRSTYRNILNTTLEDYENGKISLEEAEKSITQVHYFSRTINMIDGILGITAGVTLNFVLENNKYSYINDNSSGYYFASLFLPYITLISYINMMITPKGFVKEDYYPEFIYTGEELDLLKNNEETYAIKYKQDVFAHAKMRSANLPKFIALHILGTSMQSTGILLPALYSENKSDFGWLYLLTGISLLENIVVTPFQISNAVKLRGLINNMEAGKISFKNGIEDMKIIYKNLKTINIIAGITNLTSSALILAGSFPNWSSENFIRIFLPLTFMIPLGIYQLVEAGNIFPDEKYYEDYSKKDSDITFNINPYPIFDNDGVSKLGILFSIKW